MELGIPQYLIELGAKAFRLRPVARTQAPTNSDTRLAGRIVHDMAADFDRWRWHVGGRDNFLDGRGCIRFNRSAFWRKYPDGLINCSIVASDARRIPSRLSSRAERKPLKASSTFVHAVFCIRYAPTMTSKRV